MMRDENNEDETGKDIKTVYTILRGTAEQAAQPVRSCVIPPKHVERQQCGGLGRPLTGSASLSNPSTPAKATDQLQASWLKRQCGRSIFGTELL